MPNPKVYQIDGKNYRTKTLVEYHQELKNNKHVKSFALPTIENDQELRNKKYHSFKVTINDMVFDSIMESKFYLYLMELQDSSDIKSFERQKTIVLQESFKHKISGKTIRPITYIADFVVVDKDGDTTVVDIKGTETDVFKLKKKMFMYKYPNIAFLCLRWSKTKNKWLDLEDIKKEKEICHTQKKTRVRRSRKMNT